VSNNTAGLWQTGISREEVFRQLAEVQFDEVKGHWSRAFRPPLDVQEVGATAYRTFLSDNGLFSLRTDYIREVEEQVVGMCLGLFHSPPDAAGTFTSGGSESNYSALHAIREWARERFPRLTRPRIVVPYSAHPTFSKGCHYFGLTLERVPLRSDRRADVAAMAAAIDVNTVALVGSAPCWSFGVIDPIAELGELAVHKGLWLHVDACVGGYLAPFVEALGHALPPWDFRVPGVQSISADLHKYGYCPKPASTVLWRSAELKRFHIVHPDDWPGGPYRMQGFAGSRSAGPIFAAWAVMRYLGREGYLRLTRELLEVRVRLMDEIRAIPGLNPLDSDLPPIAFGSQTLDMQIVMGELRKRGWILVGASQPPLINLPLDPAANERVLNSFLADLRQAASKAAAQVGARSELDY